MGALSAPAVPAGGVRPVFQPSRKAANVWGTTQGSIKNSHASGGGDTNDNELQITSRSFGRWPCAADGSFFARGWHPGGAAKGNPGADRRRQRAGAVGDRSAPSGVLERSPQGCRRMEGGEQHARRPDQKDVAGPAGEVRRQVRASDDRGRELLHSHTR